MPLAYGGGVRTLDHARRLFGLGVEKVCVQTAALEDPSIVTRLADHCGSQSLLVSVDVKRNRLRRAQLYAASTGKVHATDWLDFMLQCVRAGAGVFQQASASSVRARNTKTYWQSSTA